MSLDDVEITNEKMATVQSNILEGACALFYYVILI